MRRQRWSRNTLLLWDFHLFSAERRTKKNTFRPLEGDVPLQPVYGGTLIWSKPPALHSCKSEISSVMWCRSRHTSDSLAQYFQQRRNISFIYPVSHENVKSSRIPVSAGRPQNSEGSSCVLNRKCYVVMFLLILWDFFHSMIKSELSFLILSQMFVPAAQQQQREREKRPSWPPDFQLWIFKSKTIIKARTSGRHF